MSDEQIKEMVFYHRSSAFDEKEKATLLFAERVTRGAAGVRDRSLQDLRKHYSEEEIVELTLVIAVANLTNRVNDTLQIEPDLG